MLEEICKKIVIEMVQQKAILKEDVEIYEYGLYQFFNYFVLFICVGSVSFLFDKCALVMTFYISLFVLRIMTGGIHFNKSIICFVFSLLVCFIPIILDDICLMNGHYLSLIIYESFWLLTFIIKYKITEKSLISKNDVNNLEAKKRRGLIIYQVVFLTGMLIENNIVVKAILFSTMINSISLMFAHLANIKDTI